MRTITSAVTAVHSPAAGLPASASLSAACTHIHRMEVPNGEALVELLLELGRRRGRPQQAVQHLLEAELLHGSAQVPPG